MSIIPLDVVGCSSIFNMAHSFGVERLTDRFKLRSFTDIDSEKLQKFGKKFGAEELYTNIDDMLKAHSDGAVLVCTPTESHAKLSIAALNAGRDVLCEKPMAMTVEEAQQMLDAARKNNRVLQLCFMSRYAPCWMKIKEILDSGEIGRVMSISMTQYWDGTAALYKDWRTEVSASGGGIIADSAAHWLDIMRHLNGEITALTASGVAAYDSPFKDMDDSALVLFKFANGSIGLLRNSWRHRRPENEAETIEIYCEKGSIIGRLQTPWNNGGIQSVKVVKADVTNEYNFRDPMQRFANQLSAFADIIETRGKDSGDDGKRVLELQLAIYEAMQKQIWIDTK